jgi:hypothetical protein
VGASVSYGHISSYISVADSCGEKLAWFFGITTPKYQSAIDEFYRLKSEVTILLSKCILLHS